MRPTRLGSRWFRSFGEVTDPVCEVVCFPHAGGSAAMFQTWHRATSALRITAVQLPGREVRLGERPFLEMTALVDALVPALRPLTGRPYAFYGHSMGALVAFEVLRRFTALELPLPRALFVSGRDAPQYGDQEEVHHLPDAELLARLRAWEGMEPQDLSTYEELVTLMLPTIRADLTLAETYRYAPGPALPVPVRVLRGARDPLMRPRDAGWAVQTSAECSVREFEGGHYFVQDQERSVVAHIEAALGVSGTGEAGTR
ncbi:thioesterase domain-containing protein [Streptomyces zinciresistens K42]|uniref:Thioesterase domain-containing protein n=1 Tax=Streptomyces zinciresistens K42 TaxID=700597 RepID=G2GKM4_9ACTN|nr:thioesterase domain-containing protein [Streptomyces zinciresistens K42]